ETKETLVHFLTEMKYSPEMIVHSNLVNVPVSTIYYWIHNGHLGLTSNDLLYPRKLKKKRKNTSSQFRVKGQSIEMRPEVINQRGEYGHYEIDTVILTRKTNKCLLV
nr:IS30 family transposase [Globicatella sanguinis]